MKNKLYLIFIILSASLLSSCKELTGEATGANTTNNQQEVIGGVSAISAGDNKFILNGTVDNGGNSGHGFRLKFTLPEGESLKFYFYTSDNFDAGLVYSFSKKEGVVNLEMSVNGLSHSIELEDFNDSEIIDLDVDVHNDHSDIHQLVWDRNGPHEFYEECTFEGDCIYNSEDFAFDIWLGVGRASGTFWGVEGDKSLILKLEGPLPPLTDV